MKPLLISFSGGRTSAAMAKYLKDKYEGKRDMLFVFANTGKERPETLDFINECDKRWSLGVVWIEAEVQKDKGAGTLYKIVSYDTADRKGVIFESMIAKYGIPNKAQPHCTRDLKIVPIHKLAKDILGKDYETAIGIRIDEVHRINWEKAKDKQYIYPLATELKATSQSIRKFWDGQDFDLQLKDYEGNCDMCWKKSERKLLTMILETPSLIDWWVDMETKYGGDENYSFFRANKSGLDLIELSKQPFRKSVDLWDLSQQAPKMFTDLDIEFDCFCKST
jgi:hypothetical protein